jgi:hypothetical protein
MQYTSDQTSQMMQECVNNCLTSHATCLETIKFCLQKGGEHASPDHIKLLQDCADICVLNVGMMLRDSDFQRQIGDACADINEKCASECERLSKGDDVMARCAEVNRECADSCRRMSEQGSSSAAG